MERIRLWIPEPDDAGLLTMNTARGRIHWRTWARLTSAWREQAKLEAEGSSVRLRLGGGERVQIDALPIQGPGGVLADPLGHAPTLKACIDGLRDALWIPDDSGVYVSAITMLPPVRARGIQAELGDPAVAPVGPGMMLDLTTMPAIVPALF